MTLWPLVFIAILSIWLLGVVLFRNKPAQLSGRDKIIAWLFFGSPFLVTLFFQRKLTTRELIGWGIFLLVVIAGIAFQEITCLGIGRGQTCM